MPTENAQYNNCIRRLHRSRWPKEKLRRGRTGYTATLAEAVVAGKVKDAEAAAAEPIRFTFETVVEIRRDNLRLETSLNRVQRSDLVAG